MEEMVAGGGQRRKRKRDEYPGTIRFKQQEEEREEEEEEAMQQMKEMMYRAAALRPVCHPAAADVRPRVRRNVRISSDPQTVAARLRRERISERLRLLQKLVPGASKMDTASMLDEAANYLKFLRSQLTALQAITIPTPTAPIIIMEEDMQFQCAALEPIFCSDSGNISDGLRSSDEPRINSGESQMASAIGGHLSYKSGSCWP